MVGRREFIRGVTATTAFSGIGVVGASQSKNKSRVDSKITKAYIKGGPERVSKILENRGIAHTQSTQKITSSPGGNNTEIGTADHYEESESELNIVISERPEDNRILCTVNMTLRDISPSARSSTWVEDIIGIGFNDSVWALVGTPTIGAIAEPDDAGGHNADFWPGSIDGGGLAAKIDLGWGEETGLLPETTYISLQTDLMTAGRPGTLWGYYEHTWSNIPGGAIESISGGAGPLTVTLGFNASTLWDEMESVDPAPYL